MYMHIVYQVLMHTIVSLYFLGAVGITFLP